MKVYIVTSYAAYEGHNLWETSIAYTDIEKARAHAEKLAAGKPDYYGPWSWNGDRMAYAGQGGVGYEVFEYDVED